MSEYSPAAPFQSETSTRSRLLWPIFIRLLVSFLGLIYLITYREYSLSSPETIALFTSYGVNILYLYWIQREQNYFWLAVTQIGVDLLLISFGVYLQSVFYSIYPFLYFAIVLYAPIITEPMGGVLTASFSTVFISVISLLYFLFHQLDASLPGVPDSYVTHYAQTKTGMIPYIISFGVCLHVVGFLAGYLVKRVGTILYLNQKILKHTMDGVVALSENGRVYPLNEKAKELLPLRNPPPQPNFPISYLEPQETWNQIYQDMKKQKQGQWQIELHRSPDDTRYLEVSLSRESVQTPGLFSNKQFYFLYLRDVTDRVETERIRSKAKQLEALSNLGASIAHEIRNPLSSIRSAIQELHDYAGDDISEQDQKLLSLVLDEADRTNRIIEDFLNYARDRSLNLRENDLSSVVDDVVKMVSTGTENDVKSSSVETKLHNGVIYADKDQLKQLLYNLLMNAFKHNDPDGTITIHSREEKHFTSPGPSTDRSSPSEDPSRNTSTRNENTANPGALSVPGDIQQQNGVLVQVKDEGPGISEQDLAHVFEPFFTTSEDGSGLGLAVCDQIVQAHGGWIQAENRSNKDGAIFTFWLPHRNERNQNTTTE